MSDEVNKATAVFELSVERAIADANKLVSAIAGIDTRSKKTAQELTALEKQAVSSARALSTLSKNAAGLVSAMGSGTGAINKESAALDQLRKNADRARASLKEVTALQMPTMGKNITGTAQTVSQNAAYQTYQPNLQFTKQLDAQEKAYATYSNNIVATARNQAATEQRLAYQTYAQNMPAALKQTQNAAYASYNQNIIASRQLANANQGLISQRYALYDVARTWTVVSTALLGAAAASFKISVDYERNFANVRRTTGAVGEQVAELRRDLVDLSTVLPTTFQDIAAIAALGGQLNIPTAGIEDFTEVTAKLTATTNLSSEAAGTALGRFQALLGTPTSKFENLGSAILKVGINSVATESQIVSVATQISSMGKFAGLTGEQVIGLSGALASVGGQPELSRGTITRTFTLMSKAVAEGGDALDRFAALSGVSAEEFKRTWGTEAFASTFQGFLRGIGTAGDQAVASLESVGITSVRDVPLLMRLAGATDVVTRAFADAKSGYEDGTELGIQYGIVAETISAKLTMLGNTLKAIIDSIGSSSLGPIGGLLDIIQRTADAFLMISRNPVGKFFLGVAASVGILVGVLAAYRMAQALTLGSMFAMKIAQEALGSSAVKSTGALRGLAGMMVTQGIGAQRAAVFNTNYANSLALGSSRTAAFTAGLRGMTAASHGLAGGFRAIASATVWMAVLGAGVAILSNFIERNRQAAEQVDALTASLDENTGALTENSREAIYNSLIKGDIEDRARRLGISLRLVTDAAMGETAATNQLSGEYETLLTRISELQQIHSSGGGLTGSQVDELEDSRAAAEDYAWILNAVGIGTRQVADAQEAFGKAQEAGVESSAAAVEGLEELDDALQEVLDTEYELIGNTVAVQNAIFGLGASLAENGTSFNAYSEGGRANLEALERTISAMVTSAGGDSAALAVMLAGLMQQLSSYGVNAVGELAFVQRMIAQLTGGSGTEGLGGVADEAARAGNALSQGFSSGAKKAARSGGSAAKVIKTLTDYVRDLESVVNSAFDIRFGLENSLDEVADAWQAVFENSEEAAQGVRDALQAIREADAEIQGLNAAKTTLDYQLRVAQEYGDVLRANEIIAEMAENSVDLTDAQRDRQDAEKDLTKAQDASSKSLDGSTESSREQRALVQSLIEAYNKEVSSLANTGLSQADLARRTAELREQFVRQLTQMGYNRTEVDRYALAFDDLTYSIYNVPRNITVNADTRPAVRALEEFLAKAASSSASVGVGASGDGYGAGYNAGLEYGRGWSAGQGITRKLKVIKDSGVTGGIKYTYDGVNFFMRKGGEVPQYLASGGGVGGLHPGAPKGVDTVPIWGQPGEFMFRKRAVDYYGLPYMNALNNMQAPRHMAAGGPVSGDRGGGAAIQLVELLPSQLRQLADSLSVLVAVDGRELTSVVNRTNASSVKRGSN